MLRQLRCPLPSLILPSRSTTGAFRLERDVLSAGPLDLLFVEFAVNDDQVRKPIMPYPSLTILCDIAMHGAPSMSFVLTVDSCSMQSIVVSGIDLTAAYPLALLQCVGSIREQIRLKSMEATVVDGCS